MHNIPSVPTGASPPPIVPSMGYPLHLGQTQPSASPAITMPFTHPFVPMTSGHPNMLIQTHGASAALQHAAQSRASTTSVRSSSPAVERSRISQEGFMHQDDYRRR